MSQQQPTEPTTTWDAVLTFLVATLSMLGGIALATVGVSIWLGIGPGLAILGVGMFAFGRIVNDSQ